MATYPSQFVQQFFDNNGDPLNGGLVYTYLAGTTTPAVTYIDQAQSQQNQNPVELDSAGRGAIWLPANTAYKFVIKTSAGATLQTIDQIYGVPDLSGNITVGGNLVVNGNTTLGDASGDALTIRPNAVTWSNNPTHSGDHVFSGNVSVQGNTTLGNAVGDSVTVTASTITQATGATGLSLVANTSDGADNSFVRIAGGGSAGSSFATRGARVVVIGNEASGGGSVLIGTGEVSGAEVRVTIFSSNGSFAVETGGSSDLALEVKSSGSVAVGRQAALATNATAGFLYVPTCAGTPTGVPTSVTGLAPIIVNTTNNKLYFYSSGAWRDAGP